MSGKDPSLPAAMVKPKSGTLTWFMDRETYVGVSAGK